QGAGGAEPGHEVGDAPLGLVPQFGAGGGEVGGRVGLVAVLVGEDVAVGVGRDEVADVADGAVGPGVGVAFDDGGAIGGEDLLALDRGAAWHDEFDRETDGGAKHGVGDAGVSGGGVDQHLASLKFAAGEGGADDAEGGPVLDRASGIGPFGLQPDLHGGIKPG